jgi:hypothetical protein
VEYEWWLLPVFAATGDVSDSDSNKASNMPPIIFLNVVNFYVLAG